MRDIIGDQYALFFLTLWILWTFFCLFNIVVFFQNQQSAYIKCRFPWLTFCSAIGQYCMMTSLTWKIIVLPQNFMNFFDHWFIWLFIPLHLLPYPIRSLRFILKYQLQMYETKYKNEQDKHRFLKWCHDDKHVKFTTDKAFFIYNWIIMAIAIIIGVCRAVLIEENHWGHYSVKNSGLYYASCAAMLVIASIVLWLAVHFLRKTDEKLFITHELTAIGIFWDVFITLYLLFSYIDKFDFRISTIFLFIDCVGSFLVSFGMPVQWSFVKTRNVVSSVGKLNTLNGVLNDQKARALFLDFLTFSKDCKECLLFYDAVMEYKNINDREIRIKEFKEICDTYVQNGVPLHVNVSSKLIDEVLNTKMEDISPEVFDKMFRSNLSVLQTDAFREFKTTKEFKNYETECKSAHYNTE